MKKKYILILLLTVGFVTSCVVHPDSNDTVPSDFRLVAQYGAGFSSSWSWKLTITADGKASQEAYPGFRSNNQSETVYNSFTLTQEELRQLIAKVNESRFYSLVERYEGQITDLYTMILQVSMNNKSHRVLVYAMPAVEDKAAMKRFDLVWNEVLRVVPSPNPGQKPTVWLEKQ